MAGSKVANWAERYAEKVVSAEQAAGLVRPGQRVFIGSGAGEPQALVEALAACEDIADTEIVHIMTLGIAPYTEPRLGNRFRHNAFFIGPNVRGAIAEGRADYTPIFLSEVPALFRSGRLVIDVALISVSEPDEHGYCSFGVSCDVTKSAAESATMVIAEVNSQMPRVLGDCFIHVRDIDHLVASDRAILEAPPEEPDDTAQRIGKHIASLIEDGATLQMGIGTIPDAVLRYLDEFKNLGIHTEMFSDGVIRLIEKGVITNAEKTLHRGKIVMSFVLGTRRLYDFIDDNPMVECHPTEYVNDPFIIAKNEKMIAINSAIEVDLTGQVCSDSLGPMFYSGIGGQVDFVRGAARSKGGKPIIALPATAGEGAISRIVPQLKSGAGVVTSRGDVHYVVTEYGVAYLHGKTMRERAMALIQVADPRFQPWLLAEAKARKLIYADQIEPKISAPQYPEELERWLDLPDGGRVFMRPSRMTDEAALRDLFYKLSPESVQNRFFQMLRTMPHERLQEFLRVDYKSTMALVVLTSNAAGAAMIGLAHYELDSRTNMADAAFLVRDDWQGRGIGTVLMESLIDAARRNGIAGFTADVMQGNHDMLNIFHRCGHAVESEVAEGVYHLTIPFKKARRKRERRKDK